MMRLPEALEQKLWQDIEQLEGEKKMKYVTSIERMAIERGLQQGLEQGVLKGIEQGIEQGVLKGLEQGMQRGIVQGIELGESRVLERQLVKRFGPLTDATSQRLKTATTEQLERWADRILDAPTLSEVFSDH
jgi:flagellar biosynthesis/type III secretory pathway protein FliH